MKKRAAYWFLIPAMILLVITLIIPLVRVIAPSFGGEVPFSKYIAFFTDEYYRTIFLRTLGIATVTTLIVMILGVPVAYFISRCNKKWQGLLLSVSIFPLMTNSVVRSFAWITILGNKGIINSIAQALHLINEPMKMLYTSGAIITGSVYLFLPLMIVTLTGVMENVDDDLMSAAMSLGANRFKAFMKVVLPISLPGIIVGSILVFTGALTAYTTPQLLGGNRKLVLSTLIYQKAMTVGDWDSAAMIAFIMIVVTLLFMKIFQAVAKRLDQRGGKA